MGKRELIALLNLSSWCLVMVERLFLAVPPGCLQFVIVVFPDHTHLLFLHFCRHGNFRHDFVLEEVTSIRLKLHGERWHHSSQANQPNCKTYGDIAFKSPYLYEMFPV